MKKWQLVHICKHSNQFYWRPSLIFSSEHYLDNSLFSVSLCNQLCTTVPCYTRTFYILYILQKVSGSRMSNQNLKCFLATEFVCSRKASWCICIIKLAWCLKELDVNEIHFERSLEVDSFNIILFVFQKNINIHIAIWNNTEAKTKARANGVSFRRQPRSTVWFICLTM